MGLHFAGEGSVATRLHTLTRQLIFAGPGMVIAQEVSSFSLTAGCFCCLFCVGVATEEDDLRATKHLHTLHLQSLTPLPQIGDAACGGQVLMTHAAWVMLQESSSMCAAGFPVVRCLGQFQLQVRGGH